jgi:predicted permease
MARWFVRWLRWRVPEVFARDARDRGMDQELQFHLEMLTQQYIQSGMSQAEARREARRRFGGVPQIKERGHEVRGRGMVLLETIWQDARHAVRVLAHNPGFSLMVIVSIAIGVGANAAMFSAADTLVLRPLTVPRPGDIVELDTLVSRTGFQSPTSSALSYPDYIDVRDRTRSFSSLMAYQVIVAGFTDRSDQPARRKFGMAVSGNMFDSLSVQAALGRAFGVEEDRVPGRDAVVVLDHDTWQQDFGGDHTILGRSIHIGAVEMTIIGVMPPGFTGPDQFVRPGYYIPLAMLSRVNQGMPDELTRRGTRNLAVKGRLARAVSVAQADAEVRQLAANLERQYPETNRTLGFTVRKEFDARVAARPQLAVMAAMLMALAIVVLLVACANVAGLFASRAPVRAREMALRLAIGAGRPRLIRQLVVESLWLAAGGGILGLVFGYGVISTFRRIQILTDVPLKLTFELDQRVVFVGLTVAVFSALLSSVVPAWRSSRVDVVTTLKATTGEPPRVRLWGRHALVCGQIAMSLVLLTIAVFLFRGYQSEFGRGPGFRTARMLMMTFDPQLVRYDQARTDDFYRLLTERAKGLPGVVSVTLASVVPLDQINIENTLISPEGFEFPKGTEHVRVLSAHVDETYFETLGIAVVGGRAFRSSDTTDTPRVAVVNETTAARYWPGLNPVGRRFRLKDAGDAWVEIVGVAANVKYRALGEAPNEFVYYARRQAPSSRNTLFVATTSGSASQAAPLRELVRTIDPNMPVFDVRTMENFYDVSGVSSGRILVEIVGEMGAVGLLLAMVGLYGLVAYSVSRRTREIGIRMAVGANAGIVLRMVLRQGLIMAAAGVSLGLLGSIATSGLLRAAFPFPGIERFNLTSYAVVVPVLLATTAFAALVPALRAARIDPVIALRQQ